MKNNLHAEYRKIFNKEAENAYFSPGRVNLIGEHIDYNGGLVMPCAITFGTYVLASVNDEGVFRFRSLNFDDKLDIPLQQGYSKTKEHWYNYPLGIIDYFLKQHNELKGLDLLFYGDIPISSGLSSSASIEVVTAYMLNDLFECGYSKLELVQLSKEVENEFIGVNCGIMDQFAVAFGEKDKALMLNCDSLEYKAVDSNLGEYCLAIINTNKPRKLAESKYNERVQECQAALKALQQELDIQNLCDIDAATFRKYQHLIEDTTVLKRATHVIEENDRVKQAAEALAAHDLNEFGRLMYASHDSLKNLYEVSGKELDAIAEYGKTNPDVAGARMTGAGFGGCGIALVKQNGFDRFSKGMIEYYTAKIGYAPSVYSSSIGDGVGVLKELANS
ncbi:MAG: galactokinase [Bacteroidetes bacterium]|nr:galactokinase [Bacteroidota bacterium]